MEKDFIEAADLLNFPEFRQNTMRTAQNTISKIRKRFGLHSKQCPTVEHLVEYFKKYAFTHEYIRKYIGQNRIKATK